MKKKKMLRVKTTSKRWYDEISLGVLKVCRVGNGLGFIIPKRFIDRGILSKDDRAIVVVLKRNKSISDEFTKAELAEIDRWLKLKETEKQLLERSLNELKLKG